MGILQRSGLPAPILVRRIREEFLGAEATFRRLIHNRFGAEVAAELPGRGASFAELAAQSVAVLEARGDDGDLAALLSNLPPDVRLDVLAERTQYPAVGLAVMLLVLWGTASPIAAFLAGMLATYLLLKSGGIAAFAPSALLPGVTAAAAACLALAPATCHRAPEPRAEAVSPADTPAPAEAPTSPMPAPVPEPPVPTEPPPQPAPAPAEPGAIAPGSAGAIAPGIATVRWNPGGFAVPRTSVIHYVTGRTPEAAQRAKNSTMSLSGPVELSTTVPQGGYLLYSIQVDGSADWSCVSTAGVDRLHGSHTVAFTDFQGRTCELRVEPHRNTAALVDRCFALAGPAACP